MSWLTDIFSNSVSKVIDSVGNALDKLFTSDEEREKAKILLAKVESELKLELGKQALEYDKEITERWKSDNEHWLTRLVRPAIVVWSFMLLTIVIIFDGNVGDFHINPAYIPIIQSIVTTSVVAYMGARTIDKIGKNFKKN